MRIRKYKEIFEHKKILLLFNKILLSFTTYFHTNEIADKIDYKVFCTTYESNFEILYL